MLLENDQSLRVFECDQIKCLLKLRTLLGAAVLCASALFLSFFLTPIITPRRSQRHTLTLGRRLNEWHTCADLYVSRTLWNVSRTSLRRPPALGSHNIISNILDDRVRCGHVQFPNLLIGHVLQHRHFLLVIITTATIVIIFETASRLANITALLVCGLNCRANLPPLVSTRSPWYLK